MRTPTRRILIGGLALDTPNTTDPKLGKPENFFEGILRSGAGNSFDIVAFHSYPWFSNRPLDYDYDADTLGPWKSLGGFTLGKAKFLRAFMAKYGVVDKPLFLNETSMICSMPPVSTCPGPVFYRAQVNFLIRMLARGWAADIRQFSWFTLDWPGYRSGSLLDQNQRPRQVYTAYQNFIAQTSPGSSAQRASMTTTATIPASRHTALIEVECSSRCALGQRSLDLLCEGSARLYQGTTISMARRSYRSVKTTIFPSVSARFISSTSAKDLLRNTSRSPESSVNHQRGA